MSQNIKYSPPQNVHQHGQMLRKYLSIMMVNQLLLHLLRLEYDFKIAKSSHEIEGDWIGIIHDPIDTHKYYKNHGKFRNHLKGKGFLKSFRRCKGLFFLTKNRVRQVEVCIK